ncbi:MAG: hypothetical protein AAGC43_02950 [Bacteroidota bacterium]
MLLGIVLIFFFLFWFGNFFQSKNLLEKDGIKTIGQIVDFKHVQKSAYTYYYEYYVNGKKYKTSKASSYFECAEDKSGCIGEKYQVIYSKSNPDVSDIDLESNNRFKRGRLYY